MISDAFDRFSEMVERLCFLSWRKAFGGRAEASKSVTCTLFTREERPSSWVLTFSLRVGDEWCQARYESAPVDMDEASVPYGSPGPANVASMAASRLVEECARKAVEAWNR